MELENPAVDGFSLGESSGGTRQMACHERGICSAIGATRDVKKLVLVAQIVQKFSRIYRAKVPFAHI